MLVGKASNSQVSCTYYHVNTYTMYIGCFGRKENATDERLESVLLLVRFYKNYIKKAKNHHLLFESRISHFHSLHHSKAKGEFSKYGQRQEYQRKMGKNHVNVRETDDAVTLGDVETIPYRNNGTPLPVCNNEGPAAAAATTNTTAAGNAVGEVPAPVASNVQDGCNVNANVGVMTASAEQVAATAGAVTMGGGGGGTVMTGPVMNPSMALPGPATLDEGTVAVAVAGGGARAGAGGRGQPNSGGVAVQAIQLQNQAMANPLQQQQHMNVLLQQQQQTAALIHQQQQQQKMFALMGNPNMNILSAGNLMANQPVAFQANAATMNVDPTVANNVAAGAAGNSNANSTGRQTFPMKLHEILSDPSIEHAISWAVHGRAWRVHDTKSFSSSVLPMHFKHSSYKSFTRQVNFWGFNRITSGPDQNYYYHELFLRGNPLLARQMQRKKQSNNKSQRGHQDGPDFYQMPTSGGNGFKINGIAGNNMQSAGLTIQSGGPFMGGGNTLGMFPQQQQMNNLNLLMQMSNAGLIPANQAFALGGIPGAVGAINFNGMLNAGPPVQQLSRATYPASNLAGMTMNHNDGLGAVRAQQFVPGPANNSNNVQNAQASAAAPMIGGNTSLTNDQLLLQKALYRGNQQAFGAVLPQQNLQQMFVATNSLGGNMLGENGFNQNPNGTTLQNIVPANLKSNQVIAPTEVVDASTTSAFGTAQEINRAEKIANEMPQGNEPEKVAKNILLEDCEEV